MAGTHQALGRFFAQAEVVFEYRSTEAPGLANQRVEYRQGFFLFYDKLWETVSLRNDKQHYRDRFVMYEVPTLREGSTREAILNAVSHRDYRHSGSIFIRCRDELDFLRSLDIFHFEGRGRGTRYFLNERLYGGATQEAHPPQSQAHPGRK